MSSDESSNLTPKERFSEYLNEIVPNNLCFFDRSEKKLKDYINDPSFQHELVTFDILNSSNIKLVKNTGKNKDGPDFSGEYDNKKIHIECVCAKDVEYQIPVGDDMAKSKIGLEVKVERTYTGIWPCCIKNIWCDKA